mmetsp:Transcript_27358/g.64060  ORF Transcript_27358/g.64060 Transcript_27358/m.64060 type:complete len:224 (+) Transcript_27358:455-1126(+)
MWRWHARGASNARRPTSLKTAVAQRLPRLCSRPMLPRLPSQPRLRTEAAASLSFFRTRMACLLPPLPLKAAASRKQPTLGQGRDIPYRWMTCRSLDGAPSRLRQCWGTCLRRAMGGRRIRAGGHSRQRAGGHPAPAACLHARRRGMSAAIMGAAMGVSACNRRGTMSTTACSRQPVGAAVTIAAVMSAAQSRRRTLGVAFTITACSRQPVGGASRTAARPLSR